MVICVCTNSLGKQGIQKKLFTRISNGLNTYIHTERRNVKTFRKENYTICLIEVVACLIFNMELNMILIVLMDFACIALDSLLVCNIIRFFFNRLLGGKFVT